jgi:hypothetical protein
VTSVAWSADGARLASAAEDKTVRVWDAHTGACLEVIRGTPDLTPFVTPGNPSPWRAEIQGLETVIVSAAQGQAIAWFPQVGSPRTTYAAHCTRACGIGDYVCVFTLEGNPDQPTS